MNLKSLYYYDSLTIGCRQIQAFLWNIVFFLLFLFMLLYYTYYMYNVLLTMKDVYAKERELDRDDNVCLRVCVCVCV